MINKNAPFRNIHHRGRSIREWIACKSSTEEYGEQWREAEPATWGCADDFIRSAHRDRSRKAKHIARQRRNAQRFKRAQYL